jgi:hypothetical protein
MGIPPVDLGYLLERSTELCARLADAWEDLAPTAAGSAGPEVVKAGLDELFAVLQRIEDPLSDEHPGRLGTAELRDLAGHGVGLLAELAGCARQLGMDHEASAAEALTVPFSVLMAREGAELAVLEPVVNALAGLANGLSEPADLVQLFGLIGEILAAVSPALAQDTDRTEPQRPWRVLLLNRAIVATRSHRPALMAMAFDTVLEHLPEEAPRFFEEGMAQMDALDYPPPVREVMERYYLRHGPARRTLH